MLGWELPPSITGGLGVACDGLLRGLGNIEGIDINFFLPLPPAVLDDYPASVRIVGLQPCAFPERVAHAPRGSYVAYREMASDYALAVSRALDGIHNFDLIHAHDWLTFEAALAIKRASDRPLIVHIHSTEHDRAGHHAVTPAIAELEATGMHAADRIIAVSNYTKACLVRDYDQDASKIHVVHNGSRYAAKHDRVSVPEDYVCFIGRVTQQKGPEAFVGAASLIHERMPNVRFVMAGDGNLLPQMRSLVRALGIADVFTFPGFIDHEELKHLLMSCRVLVMPSLSEPFGLIGLEAICAGVPVVVSKNSGLAEVVPSALRVDPEDVESIADVTSMLLNNQAWASQYAEITKKEVANVNWDYSAAALLNVYEAVLERSIASRS